MNVASAISCCLCLRTRKKRFARMHQEERNRGFHDLLAFLEDEIALDGLQLLKHGADIGVQREETLYYDFVCRTHGDDWPDDN